MECRDLVCVQVSAVVCREMEVRSMWSGKAKLFSKGEAPQLICNLQARFGLRERARPGRLPFDLALDSL